MKIEKLVYISNIAVPQQIEFSKALSRIFDVRFFFYESPLRTRGSFWCVDLGECAEVLADTAFFKIGPLSERYYSSSLINKIAAFNPDIVVIAGLSIPSNYFAYRWAKKNGRKCVAFMERSRDSRGKLRRRSIAWRFLKFIYKDLDLLIVCSADAIHQYAVEFGFGKIVVEGRYASDIDRYYQHPIRNPEKMHTILFANRLTDIYDPILALKVFSRVKALRPNVELLMNSDGELFSDVRDEVSLLNLNNSVRFIEGVKNWNDLGEIYRSCDVLFLPAKFSNGNFTIIEAMASGMGIVISDQVLGVGHLIKDGVNGYRANNSVDELSIRLLNYIDRPFLISEHAKLNREIVSDLGPEGTAILFKKIFEEELVE